MYPIHSPFNQDFNFGPAKCARDCESVDPHVKSGYPGFSAIDKSSDGSATTIKDSNVMTSRDEKPNTASAESQREREASDCDSVRTWKRVVSHTHVVPQLWSVAHESDGCEGESLRTRRWVESQIDGVLEVSVDDHGTGGDKKSPNSDEGYISA